MQGPEQSFARFCGNFRAEPVCFAEREEKFFGSDIEGFIAGIRSFQMKARNTANSGNTVTSSSMDGITFSSGSCANLVGRGVLPVRLRGLFRQDP